MQNANRANQAVEVGPTLEVVPNLFICTPDKVPPNFDAMIFCTCLPKVYPAKLASNLMMVQTFAPDAATANIILHSHFPEANWFIHNYRNLNKKVYVASNTPNIAIAIVMAYLMQAIYLTKQEATVLLSDFIVPRHKITVDYMPAVDRWAATLASLAHVTKQINYDYCEGDTAQYGGRVPTTTITTEMPTAKSASSVMSAVSAMCSLDLTCTTSKAI